MGPQTAIRKKIEAMPALAEDVPPDSLARWIHTHAPFPLGDPMHKLRLAAGAP